MTYLLIYINSIQYLIDIQTFTRCVMHYNKHNPLFSVLSQCLITRPFIVRGGAHGVPALLFVIAWFNTVTFFLRLFRARTWISESSVVDFVFNDLRWDVFVNFVDIAGIVDLSLFTVSFHSMSFCPFISFGHCIICPSIYSFWLLSFRNGNVCPSSYDF